MLVRVSDGKVQPLFIPENGIVMEWFGPAPAGNWADAEPTPTQAVGEGEAVEGWKGTITKLEPGNQFGRYFQREDGERYDISGTNDAANAASPRRSAQGHAASVGARVLWRPGGQGAAYRGGASRDHFRPGHRGAQSVLPGPAQRIV